MNTFEKICLKFMLMYFYLPHFKTDFRIRSEYKLFVFAFKEKRDAKL